jgi:hypothetical protein
MDSIITHDLKRYRASSDGTPEGVDETIDYQVDGLYALLEPYKGQILGVGHGNHEDEIVKRCATNPSKRLAEKLGCPYLGLNYFFVLVFRENGARGRSVVIRGHHGWGGGSRTRGGSITKYSHDTGYYDADIFLYGHDHKLQFDEIPRISIAGDKLIQKPKTMCLCGSFKKTMVDSPDCTWEESKGFPPVVIGGLDITIKPQNNWVEVTVDKRSYY